MTATAKRLIEPRGLDRAQAAAYVGVGTGTFDAMVADGRMPRPKCINARRVWDRHELDSAFDNLPYAGEPAGQTGSDNPYDGVRV